MISRQIVLGAFFVCAMALDDPRLAKLLDNQLERTGTGHYFFRFESSDGIIREEEGNVIDENSSDSPVIVKGSYTYTDDTGKVFTVRYIADENGFHPEGDHISVPPYVINTNPESPVVINSPRPQIPIRYVSTTPRPQFVSTTPSPRPEITTPTRIQIPLNERNAVTPNPVPFNQLDPKVQNSIVDLLSNGFGRGFNIPAVNSL